MDLENIEPIPVPDKSPRTRRRRAYKRRSPAIKMENGADEFPGLTRDNCSRACTIDRCVITQKPICGHPCKGGLQPPDQADTKTHARFMRAIKHLKVAELEQQQ